MQTTFSDRLAQIANAGKAAQLLTGLKGIEKESLRLSADGAVSQRPHPAALGAALTHPHITTDYSEALIELVTPPSQDITDVLAFLQHTHQFVYQHLGDELLLPTSMPCGIEGDESIPLANYGRSNIGQMKHVYRRGLSYRYGRSMQAVAGIHFNYSVPEAFWPWYQEQLSNSCSLRQFIDDSYMGMIRSIRSNSWLLTYLFGASPAFCQSFLNSRAQLKSQFQALDAHTLYRPFSTSLRMSEIGYQSAVQTNLHVSFNHLDEYISDLSAAIQQAWPAYQRIGIKQAGEYRQLNDAILQIENEYYSPVRPKQPIRSCEKPTHALQSRGVEYIELRMLDLNPDEPLGINEQQCRFLEAFALYSLLQPSIPHCQAQANEVRANLLQVASDGRNPDLQLCINGQTDSLQAFATPIFSELGELCALLDEQLDGTPYTDSVLHHQTMISNASTTLSAKVLNTLRETQAPFASFALQQAQQHQDYFQQLAIDQYSKTQFEQWAEESIAKQLELENSDTLSFDEFLQGYFSQTLHSETVC